MKKRWGFIALFLVIAAAAGLYTLRARQPAWKVPAAGQLKAAFPANGRTVFEQSDGLTLYSINPSWIPGRVMGRTGAGMFHSFQIRGATEVTDARTRQTVRNVFYDGLAPEGFSAACFSPEHAIRAVKGRDTLDTLLCFTCSQIEIYFNGKKHEPVRWGSRHEAVLDQILVDAGVPTSDSRAAA